MSAEDTRPRNLLAEQQEDAEWSEPGAPDVSAEDIAAIAERLRELLAKATPGPWASGGDSVYAGSGDTYSDIVDRMAGDWPDDNAAYIAAANPETIAALLDALTQAETREKALRASLDQLGVDLVNDHRGIPYDVIERVDEARALLEGGQS